MIYDKNKIWEFGAVIYRKRADRFLAKTYVGIGRLIVIRGVPRRGGVDRWGGRKVLSDAKKLC